jgi:hypothetical protein
MDHEGTTGILKQGSVRKPCSKKKLDENREALCHPTTGSEQEPVRDRAWPFSRTKTILSVWRQRPLYLSSSLALLEPSLAFVLLACCLGACKLLSTPIFRFGTARREVFFSAKTKCKATARVAVYVGHLQIFP